MQYYILSSFFLDKIYVYDMDQCDKVFGISTNITIFSNFAHTESGFYDNTDCNINGIYLKMSMNQSVAYGFNASSIINIFK